MDEQAKVGENSGVELDGVSAPSSFINAVGGCEDMTPTPNPTTALVRRSLSVRTRFEIFKRDDFCCRYCGQRTPAVVLQVDHIVPVCDGGSDDEINLVTSCWSCNSGKAGVPLESVLTAEDPNDRAIMLLERERQLREYNYVLACIRERREEFGQDLLNYWCENSGATGILKREFAWLCRQLEFVPAEVIRKAMGIAISREATDGLRYVVACLRNWREDGTI